MSVTYVPAVGSLRDADDRIGDILERERAIDVAIYVDPLIALFCAREAECAYERATRPWTHRVALLANACDMCGKTYDVGHVVKMSRMPDCSTVAKYDVCDSCANSINLFVGGIFEEELAVIPKT